MPFRAYKPRKCHCRALGDRETISASRVFPEVGKRLKSMAEDRLLMHRRADVNIVARKPYQQAIIQWHSLRCPHNQMREINKQSACYSHRLGFAWKSNGTQFQINLFGRINGGAFRYSGRGTLQGEAHTSDPVVNRCHCCEKFNAL